MISKSNRSVKLEEIIEKNPGIKFREIMRASGMSNGVLSHYLGKLEASGTVQVQRETRQTRFYPPYITKKEALVIKALRRKTPRDIISSLILNEVLEFNQIVKIVNKAPSTVSLYLSQLVENEIIDIQYLDRKKTYIIQNKLLVDKLIEKYRPDMLEQATSGFEDIINAL